MPHYLLSFQWGKTDSETVNRLMMVIHGTYDSQALAEADMPRIKKKLAHGGIDIMRIVLADSEQWMILPLSPLVESEKNTTYDRRVKDIIYQSLENQLDKIETETNGFLDKLRDRMMNQPVKMITDFQNSDQFTQYLDELLRNMELDHEFRTLMENRKTKHIEDNSELNKQAMEQGEKNILEARKQRDINIDKENEQKKGELSDLITQENENEQKEEQKTEQPQSLFDFKNPEDVIDKYDEFPSYVKGLFTTYQSVALEQRTYIKQLEEASIKKQKNLHDLQQELAKQKHNETENEQMRNQIQSLTQLVQNLGQKSNVQEQFISKVNSVKQIFDTSYVQLVENEQNQDINSLNSDLEVLQVQRKTLEQNRQLLQQNLTESTDFKTSQFYTKRLEQTVAEINLLDFKIDELQHELTAASSDEQKRAFQQKQLENRMIVLNSLIGQLNGMPCEDLQLRRNEIHTLVDKILL